MTGLESGSIWRQNWRNWSTKNVLTSWRLQRNMERATCVIFGSVARSDANEQSDIDFLAGFDLGVDLNEIWNAVENDIPELWQAVKRLVRRLESADTSERRDV